MAVYLTNWGRVTHICASKLTTIGSDNGLSPGRRQAIIWTNAGILLIGPLGINFTESFIEIDMFSFQKMHLNLSSAKRRPYYRGINVLLTGVHVISCHLLLNEITQWDDIPTPTYWSVRSCSLLKLLASSLHVNSLCNHVTLYGLASPRLLHSLVGHIKTSHSFKSGCSNGRWVVLYALVSPQWPNAWFCGRVRTILFIAPAPCPCVNKFGGSMWSVWLCNSPGGASAYSGHVDYTGWLRV